MSLITREAILNLKTTIAGVALLLVAIGQAGYALVNGEPINGDALLEALAGVGLLSAADGD
jgi:hypothetical protein